MSVQRFGEFAHLQARAGSDLPEVAEMDCNPVIVSPAAAIAVDVKIHVVPMPPSPLPGIHRMRPVAA